MALRTESPPKSDEGGALPPSGTSAGAQSRGSASLMIVPEAEEVHIETVDVMHDEEENEPEQTPVRAISAFSVTSILGPIQKLRFAMTKEGLSEPSSPQRACETLRMTDLEKKYEKGEVLGKGAYGTVYKVRERKTGKYFAMKSVHRGCGDVEYEIASSSEFDHPYLVKLHGFFRDPTVYHLVMDLCLGGDLFNFVTRTVAAREKAVPGYDSGLPSDLAAMYTGMMLTGLVFLHHYGFIHRDIKPENYLLVTKAEASPIKLADFGFARCVGPTEVLHDVVGTARYSAPEQLKGKYTLLADVWSLGVTAFAVCTGRFPFDGASKEEYAANAAKGKFRECDAAWQQHMPELRTLVYNMLTIDPEQRPSAKHLVADNKWLYRFNVKKPASKKGCGCIG